MGLGRVAAKLGAAGAILLAATACESGVTVDVTYRVPAAVAEGYAPEAPGVLVSGRVGPLAAVCGSAVDFVEYSDGFGCRPDEREEKIEAWVVPAPETWGEGLCDDPDALQGTLVTSFDTGADPYPAEDLPDRTDEDPYGSTVARWKATPICGGILRAEVVVAPPR